MFYDFALSFIAGCIKTPFWWYLLGSCTVDRHAFLQAASTWRCALFLLLPSVSAAVTVAAAAVQRLAYICWRSCSPLGLMLLWVCSEWCGVLGAVALRDHLTDIALNKLLCILPCCLAVVTVTAQLRTLRQVMSFSGGRATFGCCRGYRDKSGRRSVSLL